MTGISDNKDRNREVPRFEDVRDGMEKAADRYMKVAASNGLMMRDFTVIMRPDEQFVMPLDGVDVQVTTLTFRPDGSGDRKLAQVSYTPPGWILDLDADVTADGKLAKRKEKNE